MFRRVVICCLFVVFFFFFWRVAFVASRWFFALFLVFIRGFSLPAGGHLLLDGRWHQIAIGSASAKRFRQARELR
jgi:hypothetical protein